MKNVTHYWDEEMHDTACGYLKSNDSVTHVESLVTCKKCRNIGQIGFNHGET